MFDVVASKLENKLSNINLCLDAEVDGNGGKARVTLKALLVEFSSERPEHS